MAGESLDCALRQKIDNLRTVPWLPEPRGNVSKTAGPSLWRSQGFVSGSRSRPPGGLGVCSHWSSKNPGAKAAEAEAHATTRKSGQSWAVLGRPGHVSIRASLAATERRGMVRSRGFQGKEAKMDGKTADDSWQPFQLQSCKLVVVILTAGFVRVAGPTTVPWCCLGPLLPFYPSPACVPPFCKGTAQRALQEVKQGERHGSTSIVPKMPPWGKCIWG